MQLLRLPHWPPLPHDFMKLPLTSFARVGVLCAVGLVACTERPAASPNAKLKVSVTEIAAPASHLVVYEARRDAYRQTLTAREKRGENIEAAEHAALRELEALLRPIVGDFSAPWVVGRGRMNMQTLVPGSEDSGLPDGILYESRDSTIQVLVTTQDLMRSWIPWLFDRDSTVSREPIRALGSDDVLTQIFDRDAHVYSYADIPVAATPLGAVSAKLVSRSQDYAPKPADEVMISVARGTRIFVIDSPASDTLPIPAGCGAAADSGRAISSALVDSMSQVTERDSLIKVASDNDDRTNARFLKCYGEAVARGPRFQGLVTQVRRLVESLPER